jgi:CheY-like chemotaxis protein
MNTTTASARRPVLLIDDNPEDLFLTQRLLVKAGIDLPVVTVDGGEEAITLLRASLAPASTALMPAVIFCDVRMPQRNGFDVLRWTKTQPLLAKIPFALLTGGDMPEDRLTAKNLGADKFFVKFPATEALKAFVDSVRE